MFQLPDVWLASFLAFSVVGKASKVTVGVRLPSIRETVQGHPGPARSFPPAAAA